MKIEVNQSNKIEQTSKDTIIGLANEKSFTILINRKIKRKLQEGFRRQGKPRLFSYRTFVGGIILAFKYAKIKPSEVVIDEEYPGKEKMLHSMFLEMWGRIFGKAPEVSFERIGKKSKVHGVCYKAMKSGKADKVISFEELRHLTLK